MKKYGKYEKRPEPAASGAAKTPKMKSLLLQTYFTSLLCMVLCVTMFLGTSYAWFTSEVQNTENQIYAGMLSVGLYKQEGANRYNMATSTTNTAKLFGVTSTGALIAWEPGYTALETVVVKNEGDLAFKFELRLTDGSVVSGSSSLASIAKNFDVWVYPHKGGNGPTVTSYGNITGANSGWTHVGTLENLLDGTPVLKNETLENRDDESTYTIAVHMKETAGSSVMGCKLSLNVQLIAYQMISEADDLGKGHDDVTPASTLAELASALEAKKNIVMLSDLTIGSSDDVLTVLGGVLDGSGNTINYTGAMGANNTPAPVLSADGGAISNLTVTGGTTGNALSVTRLVSDLFVTDCTFSGASAFTMTNPSVTNYNVTFVDTNFNAPVSYANVMNHAYFTGCDFSSTVKPSGDTTFTGCDFSATTGILDLSNLQGGETVTLINCTYQGRTIERAVLTASGSNVTVKPGDDVIALNENKVVTLK